MKECKWHDCWLKLSILPRGAMSWYCEPPPSGKKNFLPSQWYIINMLMPVYKWRTTDLRKRNMTTNHAAGLIFSWCVSVGENSWIMTWTNLSLLPVASIGMLSSSWLCKRNGLICDAGQLELAGIFTLENGFKQASTFEALSFWEKRNDDGGDNAPNPSTCGQRY